MEHPIAKATHLSTQSHVDLHLQPSDAFAQSTRPINIRFRVTEPLSLPTKHLLEKSLPYNKPKGPDISVELHIG